MLMKSKQTESSSYCIKKFIHLPEYINIPTFCMEGQPKIVDLGYFVLIW